MKKEFLIVHPEYCKKVDIPLKNINFALRIFLIPIHYIMKELALKYGCNPNQKPSRIYMEEGELPIEVLNGRPGYINFLDAFNSWQLVKELKAATGLPALERHVEENLLR